MRTFFARTSIVIGLLTAFAYAQEITGSIVGTVTDATGAGVPNATVTVTNTDRNAVMRTANTDAGGNYSAPLLPIGHYSVTASGPGFKKTVKGGITLNV